MMFQTLATDYDGTLAHDGVVDGATVDGLHRAKSGGLRLLLVTGREMNDLFATFDHLKLFDRVVAENGALLFDPSSGDSRTLAPPPPRALIEQLRAADIPFSLGRSIVATVEPHEHALLEAIHDLGLEWHIIFNKGSVMALPSGVNKATGLAELLKDLEVPAQSVAAIGDAENDIAFLQAAGFPVAVANALPSVKAVANWVTPEPRGAGVVQLIDWLLSDQDHPAI